MKVLFDTNIVLDLLLDREPFSTHAAQLFSKVENKEIVGYICVTTVTTVFYLASKVVGRSSARKQIRKLLIIFEVAGVNNLVLEGALSSGFIDFGDAVLHEAALHVEVDGIVTRNISDFKKARIPVYSAEELIQILAIRNKTLR